MGFSMNDKRSASGTPRDKNPDFDRADTMDYEGDIDNRKRSGKKKHVRINDRKDSVESEGDEGIDGRVS
jgi:hypothetical protein